ncbi:Putative ribonuclease H protein At1g65750 [Linum perenne]
MRDEILGIIEGMKLAWDKGIRRLFIQTNSKATVSLLSSNDGRMHQHASLVEQFINLRNCEWEVMIQYIYCEANSSADHLANLGHSVDLGTHVCQIPGNTVLYWLRYDLIGVCTPRSINNTS